MTRSSCSPNQAILSLTRLSTHGCESTSATRLTAMVSESVSDEPSQADRLLKARVPGWYDSVYDKELGSQPCIFTSVTPVCHSELSRSGCCLTSRTQAWNNVNLQRLAEKIKSPLVLCDPLLSESREMLHSYSYSAHVRATTAGSLSLDNCHPFVHGKLMVR